MKFKKFIICAILITCVCIIYVNQQVEIVKLSYKLRSREKNLSETIDQNRVLLYNNTRLKAPQYLAGMLRQNEMNLTLPETAAVAKIRVVRKQHKQLAKSTRVNRKAHLLDFLVPRAEAALNKKR